MTSPRAVGGLLFVSGFCALSYQVAWFRALRLIFGASTASNAAVLAIFIGGLGLGGWLLGRRADDHPRPLALYGRLELIIAVLAASSPFLIDLVRAGYLAAGGPMAISPVPLTALKLLLATVVLGGPVVFMGGTLPAAVRAFMAIDDTSRRGLALAYGLNTLGSVVGAALSTFFLLELLGTRLLILTAAGLNLMVAAAAIRLAPPAIAVPSREPEAPARPRLAPLPFVLLASLSTGFVFFLMELVWYRMLGPILGGTVYTFGLILVVALAGIGIGGLLYARRSAAKESSLSEFAFTCALMGLLLILPFAAGDQLALFALSLQSLDAFGFSGAVLGWTVVDALVVLPAAIVSGYQFPLLVSLLGAGSAHVGRQVGLTYAWNTLGAILGALAGGFGVLPLLSAPGTWRLVAALLGLLALAALVLERTPRPRARLPVALLLAGLVAALTADGPTAVWRHGGIGAGRAPAHFDSDLDRSRWAASLRSSVVWEADGTESSVALIANTAYAFYIGGKSDGNARGDAPTQTMLGLIGAALHPQPKSAFVIGLGTGATAGWLGAVPSIERVDVVELEPLVLRVAEACGPVNENAMANPKVNVIVGDAREVLPTAPTRYDLVVSEPSNPYRAGIASLFTREFYESVSAKLNDDGLLIQWVQAYAIDARTLRVILTTVGQVFPHIEIWESKIGSDLVLVASRSPWTVDAGALERRLQAEPFARGLRNVWGVEGLHGFYSGYVAGPGFAKALVAVGTELDEICTDDNSLVEYGFARTVGDGRAAGVRGLRAEADRLGLSAPTTLVGRALDPTLVVERWGARSIAERRSGTPRPLPETAVAARTRQEARELYASGQAGLAVRRWQQQPDSFGAPREPPNLTDLTMLAEGLIELSHPDVSLVLDRLRRVAPLTADALAAMQLFRSGKLADAFRQAVSVLTRYQIDPWPLPALMGRLLAAATGTATDRTATDSTMAGALAALLETPFAVGALDEQRRPARLTLGLAALRRTSTGRTSFAPECVALLAEAEPWPPWEGDTLMARAACYVEHAPDRADAATDDLTRWLSQQEATLFPR